MSAGSASVVVKSATQRFRSPQTVIARFVARRTARGAAFLALALGTLVASKSAGFAAAYPTAQERAQLSTSFDSNVGFNALFGAPHQTQTVAGFTVWSTLAAMMIIGAIWAFLLATKSLRGEETSGHWELLLGGPTTARRATLNTLAGLGTSLLVLYGVAAITFIAVGHIHSVGFSTGASLFFALAGVAGAAEFMAVGALASQLMPTRGRAAGLSAAIFGVFFLLRALANTTAHHWILNLTPLGWIDKLQPLYASRPIWLLPIFSFVIILCAAAIYMAGRRDLGDSIFNDKDVSKPHTRLLGSSLGAGIRLTRGASFGWLLGIGLVGVFYGLLTNVAAQAFNDSLAAQHIVSRLAQSSKDTGGVTFLGVAFSLLMPIMMAYAASAVGAMREDEAEGYLDNLLVRPISRLRWIAERTGLIAVVIVLAGLLAGVSSWAGEASQHSGVPFHTLLLAGINTMAPALLILGVGICAFGLLPRLTTVIAYGVIAWSFLIEIISSGVNLSHWVLDTSVLHYINLAPAADPKWGTNAIMVGIAIVLCIIGAAAFNARDLQAE